MLHYFRINDPYRVIGLLLIMLLLNLVYLVDVAPLTFPELKATIVGEKVSAGATLYTEVIEPVAPLTGWTFAAVHWVFGESILAQHILAFLLLFCEAVVLGMIFIDKRAFPDSSFIPSLIFAVLCLYSFDNLSLSGTLFGLLFLLLAINSLLREMESRDETFETALRVGLFIGTASLFEFSYSVYIIAAMVVMILFARTSGRKMLLVVTGYLLPHLMLAGAYAINGGLYELWHFFYLPNLEFGFTPFVAQKDLLLLMSVPALYFLAALVVLNRESRFTKYQSQILQCMFFWTLFSLLQVYYSRTMRPHTFLPVMIGLSFFISHFFLIVVRRRFAELSFWLLLGGVLACSLYTRYGKNAYERLYVPGSSPIGEGKDVLVLADSLSLYRGNKMTTPFLDWEVSSKVFQEPEYYENVARVYHGFANHPEVIIDPNNVLAPFLERIPELRKAYRRTNSGYVRKENR